MTERDDARALHQLQGEVSFDDVSFGYLRSRPVLSGFSLRVATGRDGRTGRRVGVGQVDRRRCCFPASTTSTAGRCASTVSTCGTSPSSRLRRQIGVVFEETFLFSDTVRANIAFGRPDATDEQVLEAARAAEADRFIAELPDGYDTVVGERGLTLSGGQRQRVALARALLTDPRVLILDDATSSIDASTEEEIHATLRRLMEGRTTLLVAHRRSTLRLADRIVVVDHGGCSTTGPTRSCWPAASSTAAWSAGTGRELGEGEAERGGRRRVASAWAAVASTAGAGTRSVVPRGRPGRPAAEAWTAAWMMLAPTPELLAAVAALPPADHRPEVDVRAGVGR